MRKLLIRLLAFAGIAINVALLLINLRPGRPHISRHRRAKVLVRADAPRTRWLRENMLEEFSANYDVDFELITVNDFEGISTALKRERDHPTGLLLTAIDDEVARDLIEAGTLKPFQDHVAPALLSSALAAYIPESVERSHGPDGKVWFAPKRAEVDIVAYLSPAVEDAYLHWDQDRPAIEAALTEANGFGLPLGYSLKRDPNGWDSYDLFVAAWYWAHHPAPWADGTVRPRVAWRTGGHEEAVSDLLGGFYRHGLTDKNIGQTDILPVADELQWEALFRKHELLTAECFRPGGITSDGIDDLFHARRLAWAPVSQEDSFWLHGGSQRTADPGIPDAKDLSWTTQPAGVSLQMKDGRPVRVGRTYSFRKFHFWALPIHSPNPTLAFQMATFFTERGLQQRETEAEGQLPIRQDLREDYPILFRLDWMKRILDSSYEQIERGSGVMPAAVMWKDYDELYSRVQHAVLESVAAGPTTLTAVRSALAKATAAEQHSKAGRM